MKTKPQPIRTTIVYGLIAGLGLIPANVLLDRLLPGASGFRLIIWLYLAGYAVLLARWGGQSRLKIIYPLILLLIPVIWIIPQQAYLLCCLATLSWIRSGLCFRDHRAGRFGAELMHSMGGGLLIAGFNPYSAFSWALGIWMFFLLQALYFAFFSVPWSSDRWADDEIDRFDSARRSAEEILAQNKRSY